MNAVMTWVADKAAGLLPQQSAAACTIYYAGCVSNPYCPYNGVAYECDDCNAANAYNCWYGYCCD